MFNFEELSYRLKESNSPFKALNARQDMVIKRESDFLLKFVEEIYPFSTLKEINGEDCVLIYVFKQSDNYAISDEVYLNLDGYVTYQVYDETFYRGYVPESKIVNGFAQVELEYFLKSVTLKEIMDNFFEERPLVLRNMVKSLKGEIEERESYIEDLEKSLKD